MGALLGEHQSDPQSCPNPTSNRGRDKSFVDDLNKERGIVRMRVAPVPRSAEIQPLFWRFVKHPLVHTHTHTHTDVTLQPPSPFSSRRPRCEARGERGKGR